MIDDINLYLKNGGTISAYEREKGYGKDTIRKKLKRLGYSYNKALRQFVIQDVTQKVVQRVIKNNESAYIIKSNKKECTKMTLEEFKKLSTKEQIDFVNQFTNGEKSLKEIEKEYFEFTNIGNYINRAEGYWDGKLKRFIYIQPAFEIEDLEILKELVNNYKISKKLQLEENPEIVLKSIRTHKKTLEKFAEYCTNKKLKQQDVIALALEQYMANNQ